MHKHTVLVTGGAGYIGSHTCKILAKAGFFPIVFDNLSTGHEYAVKWGPFIKGDVCNQKHLEEVLLQYKPIAVIHFAAVTTVPESMTNPAKYYHNNLVGAFSLLEAIRQTKIIPFIFSSTCAIYGNPQTVPMDEEHPKLPISPYGSSKWMIEQIAEDYHKAYLLPFAFLRYFNACGASLESEIGEDHADENHLIPLIIQTALGKRSHINIYGCDYATDDGTAIRDYIHVLDLAQAHLLALRYLLEKNDSLIVNLGTGVGTSVNEVILAVESICGQEIPKKIAPRRVGDPPILLADPKKSMSELGFKPQYSDLTTILQSAWEWHKS